MKEIDEKKFEEFEEFEELNDKELATRIKNVSKLDYVTEKYIENLKTILIHPCYSEKAHFKVARIHLPVAPKCNIQCKYCKRDINKVENRPGVSSGIMKPKEALKFIDESIKKMPSLKIAGIAGPGEPLANHETIETFKLVKKKYPDVKLCLATNGLELPNMVNTLADINVANITITINSVDPEIFDQIYEFVNFNGIRYTGMEAGKILLENQLRGIELASRKGILVRINTVLIPTINFNQTHLIAKEALDRGAILQNIMPLIPIYAFKHFKRPTRKEMFDARNASRKFLPQFKVCKQCRADAVGIPGTTLRKQRCEDDPISHIIFHG